MENIEEGNGDTGKRNNFENAVAYILPKDPVLKIRSTKSNKRKQAQISDTNATGFGSKTGICKTGFHIRWHENPEYMKLNKDHNQELWNWQKVTKDSGGDVGPKNSNKNAKKVMAAAIGKKVDEHMAAKEKKSRSRCHLINP